MSEAHSTARRINCDHRRLKDAGPMARLGFCLYAKPYGQRSFSSSAYHRQCAQLSEATADVRAARAAWLDRRGEVA